MLFIQPNYLKKYCLRILVFNQYWYEKPILIINNILHKLNIKLRLSVDK